IGFHEGQVLVDPPLHGAIAANAEHRAVDIEYRHMGIEVRGFDDAEGDIACSACHIERFETGTLRWRKPINHRSLPGAVKARRHQIVHEIVAVRYAMEDVVDEILLLAFVHPTKAKSCLHS